MMSLRTKLSEIADVLPPHPFRGTIEQSVTSNVRAVQIRDINEYGQVDWAGCVKTDLPGKKKPNWLIPGDLIFIARGNHYAILVDETVPKNNVVASPQFFCIRVKNPEISPEYLSWLLNQEPLQSYFESGAEGARAKNVRREVLEEACIVIPSMNEQNEILHLEKMIKKERLYAEELIKQGKKIMKGVAGSLYV